MVIRLVINYGDLVRLEIKKSGGGKRSGWVG
jgi:hypothetical protein